MQEYELSVLYLPPKDWPLRAEDWHNQVDKIIAYTRQTIAQDIVEWAQKYHDNPIVENCVRIARGQANCDHKYVNNKNRALGICGLCGISFDKWHG